MKILIIDDDQVDRIALIKILKKTGLVSETVEAGTASQGIELFKQDHYDCVFLDVNLPDQHGLDLLKQMVRYGGYIITVIAITGVSGEHDSENMLKNGASDYLIKEDIDERIISRSLRYAKNRIAFQENAEYKFRKVFETSNDAIVLFDNSGEINNVNRKALDMFGYQRMEILDLNISNLSFEDHIFAPDSVKSLMSVIDPSFTENQSDTLETIFQRKDETLFYGEASIAEFQMDDQTMFLMIVRDVDRKKIIEQEIKQANEQLAVANRKLEEMAQQDSLTKLLNRRGLENVIERAVNNATRNAQDIYIILVDLDDFKHVNDNYGHSSGDMVLQEAANAMNQLIRPFDYLARIGGDEFLILVTVNSIDEIEKIAERIRQAFKNIQMIFDNEKVAVTASIGVVQMDLNTTSFNELLVQSQFALHTSKADGKDRVTFSDTSIQGSDNQQNENSDHIAILKDGKDFTVVKQPIVDLESQQIVAMEYFARGPHGSLEAPEVFFQICMEHNMLSIMDYRCLQMSLRESASLSNSIRVHLNLFPQTLIEMSPNEISKLIRKTDAERIYCIELSERYILNDPTFLKERISHFRDVGIQVALDDVGYGKSNLESLVFLEPDWIKIDDVRIRNISQDLSKRNHLVGLLKIAKSLDIDVIAEGVENKDDLDVLIEHGVRYAQGSYLDESAVTKS